MEEEPRPEVDKRNHGEAPCHLQEGFPSIGRLVLNSNITVANLTVVVVSGKELVANHYHTHSLSHYQSFHPLEYGSHSTQNLLNQKLFGPLRKAPFTGANTQRPSRSNKPYGAPLFLD